MRKTILIVAAIAAILIADTALAEGRKTLKASDHANIITATWQCQDKIPATRTKNHYYPWVPHSQAFRAAQINKWRLRHKRCKAYLDRRAYEWNWQAFPSWVIRLGVCESGGSGGAPPGVPNWFARGSSSDGTFYSAFNISRSVYDRDAHHMGVRGWYEGPGVPSPYEQAMAVIGHVRLYGDGFTGRCHGIARSSW